MSSVVSVAFGLGANLGDRRRALAAALAELARDVEITAVSSVYETAPYGQQDQPPFLNCCLIGESAEPARSLLALSSSIESRLGRQPRERWGPREIDIDLLLYGDDIIADPDLVVPHAGLTKRAFVLVPLAEIAPARGIPGRGITVSGALAQLVRSPGDVRRVGGPIAASGRAVP
jgi:dihydroneopterin aldolase/2-amino-4-hydroxy-6-hydroxymethyldihydropteridine diphosphokinase